MLIARMTMFVFRRCVKSSQEQGPNYTDYNDELYTTSSIRRDISLGTRHRSHTGWSGTVYSRPDDECRWTATVYNDGAVIDILIRAPITSQEHFGSPWWSGWPDVQIVTKSECSLQKFALITTSVSTFAGGRKHWTL